jgi:hypothetical protein
MRDLCKRKRLSISKKMNTEIDVKPIDLIIFAA